MGTTERRMIVWDGWLTKPVADGRTYALLITHAACGQILIRPGGCRKHYEQRSRRPRNACKGERKSYCAWDLLSEVSYQSQESVINLAILSRPTRSSSWKPEGARQSRSKTPTTVRRSGVSET